MKTKEYPIIRKVIKMTAGAISIPKGVKTIFADCENEATAEIWFSLLENELLCQYLLCPEIKPKALSTGILSLIQNQEIQAQIDNTALAYLQYAQKKYESNRALSSFYQQELNIRFGKKTTQIQRQKIYARVVNWLEKNLEHDIMVEHTEEISDLIKIIILCKSEIMFDSVFYEFFMEKRLDLIALVE